MNGSRLGKDYSANVFNDLYGGKQEQVQEPVNDTRLSDVYKDNNQQDNTQSPDSGLGSIFSILSPEPENQPKDDMPLPRRRKKKKRRYGRQM